jgi:hypothetical protein
MALIALIMNDLIKIMFNVRETNPHEWKKLGEEKAKNVVGENVILMGVDDENGLQFSIGNVNLNCVF